MRDIHEADAVWKQDLLAAKLHTRNRVRPEETQSQLTLSAHFQEKEGHCTHSSLCSSAALPAALLLALLLTNLTRSSSERSPE